MGNFGPGTSCYKLYLQFSYSKQQQHSSLAKGMLQATLASRGIIKNERLKVFLNETEQKPYKIN